MNDTSDIAQLDARGLYCPEPVMLLHKKIREIASGESLLVLASDPSTQRDIVKFCGFLGHVLVQQEHLGDEYHFLIRKK